ncbi:hybrid sensor histidine kinase/response regulator [Paraburkholderia acidisoli]|uniref:histidine kinase n=1 Tax=Paraburkholderia acidisoli TaxID=2571748 RepID=A0A7Z2GN62_9BURK|nr:hybrid sensor histidine kinase/response regulator [Paraburkholderia acidisoli]QGZ64862.1 response regulator [Paraburkholderia acidisoli]
MTASPPPLAILFVDDDEMSRVLFERAIQGLFHGLYPVHFARSAEEAFETLERHGHEIAVLVTDFRLPGRNGDHLLREAAQRYPHIVRILVTAYADKEMLIETVNSGEVFRILEKPLRANVLRELLQLAFDRYTETRAHRQQLLAMDETLAFLVHELSTPLATIALFARTLEGEHKERTGEPAPAREGGAASPAAAMLNNAQYCLTLVSSFWETVHKSSGAQGSPKESNREMSASRLVANLLDTYPFAGAQREWISVHVRNDFVVRAMPNCVALVLSSLISNALRELAAIESPALEIDVIAQDEPQIRIRDNGPGIAPEIMARLMQDPVTTHAESGGHGMGMIFCNRIMRSAGGSLRIDSALHQGTTVTMAFGKPKDAGAEAAS